jgi:hypothetical protein
MFGKLSAHMLCAPSEIGSLKRNQEGIFSSAQQMERFN